MKKRIIIIVFIILLFGVGSLVYLGQRNRQLEELYYSGTIEANQADISFQISGKVKEIYVHEGLEVKKGQELAVLVQDELEALRDQAKANLEISNKNLQQAQTTLDLNKKILPVEVKKAEAGVKSLNAQLSMLESGYRVQEIERAKLALLALNSTLDQARKDKERYDRLFRETIISAKEKEVVDLQYEKTLREYEQAEENLDQLKEGFRDEEIDAARAKLSEGIAGLEQARNNLERIKLYERDVEEAKARVNANMAALQVTGTRLGYANLKAPFDGIITSRNIEPGEVVTPGQEVFSLADLSMVKLKIFVPETEIGTVTHDQDVEIRIDTFPDRIFKGNVSFISQEAEFTPKIIQTHKERVKLVYLVKVLIPNPDFVLKPGMPADAWLR